MILEIHGSRHRLSAVGNNDRLSLSSPEQVMTEGVLEFTRTHLHHVATLAVELSDQS
jgi:hypothetical protein